jgi:hypothetical protein
MVQRLSQNNLNTLTTAKFKNSFKENNDSKKNL